MYNLYAASLAVRIIRWFNTGKTFKRMLYSDADDSWSDGNLPAEFLFLQLFH